MKALLYLLLTLATLGCNETRPKEGESLEDKVAIQKALFANSATAPSVRALDFSELKSFLSTKSDTIYIVNFWATWCRPCVKELPAFEKLTSQYRSKKVKVLLVSLDFPETIDNRVIPFMVKNKIESQVVLLDDSDANSWIPKISESWSGAIPATLIYNKKERRFYEQSFTFEELQNEIIKFI